jgi:hypothetical protein
VTCTSFSLEVLLLVVVLVELLVLLFVLEELLVPLLVVLVEESLPPQALKASIATRRSSVAQVST